MATKQKGRAPGQGARAQKDVSSNREPPSKPAQPSKQQSWRDVLQVHPAAELFPLLPPEELKELADDIKANGLQLRAVLCKDGCELALLDGRNRLDAIELAFGPIGREVELSGQPIYRVTKTPDPYDYVIAVNLRRRHLNREQKRELMAALLKANPEKSNRQIAKTVKASDHTVGTVRTEMEGRAQIAHVETRTDSKGREQPAHKLPARSAWTRTSAAEPEPEQEDTGDVSPEELARMTDREEARHKPKPVAWFKSILNAIDKVIHNASTFNDDELEDFVTELDSRAREIDGVVDLRKGKGR
jgi:hypothetical protein